MEEGKAAVTPAVHPPTPAHISPLDVPVIHHPPPEMRLYWVQLHELKDLMHIQRPWSFGIATMTFGAALGLIPTVINAFAALSSPKNAAESLVSAAGYCVLCAALAIVGVVTGIYALQGRKDVRKLFADIQNRPSVSAHTS